MAIRQVFSLILLAAVTWTAVGRGVPRVKTQRAVNSKKVAAARETRQANLWGCDSSEQYYEPGQLIREPSSCSYVHCWKTGTIIYGTRVCPTHCEELAAIQPDSCCRPCKGYESTAPETTESDVDVPKGCWYHGTYYEPGYFIYTKNCKSFHCKSNGDIIESNRKCPEFCESLLVSTPDEEDCCPTCELNTISQSPVSTTLPGCWYNGNYYEPGEHINYDTCDSIRCEDGHLTVERIRCPSNCGEILQMPPNKCCMKQRCQYVTVAESSEPESATLVISPEPESASPFQSPEPESPVSTTLPGCWYNGNYYEPGEQIYDDPCVFIRCEDGHLTPGRIRCPDNCEEISQMPPHDCCPQLMCEATTPEEPSTEVTTTEEPPTELTTTHLPGCWDSGKYYEPGEYIHDDPCHYTICVGEDRILEGDRLCPKECWYDGCPEECRDIVCTVCADPAQKPPFYCCEMCQSTTGVETTQESTTELANTNVTTTEKVTTENIPSSPNCPGNNPTPESVTVRQQSPILEEISDTTEGTTTPIGCWYSGEYFEPGQLIYNQGCETVHCQRGGFLVLTEKTCPIDCDELASIQPDECCYPCTVTPTEEPSTESSSAPIVDEATTPEEPSTETTSTVKTTTTEQFTEGMPSMPKSSTETTNTPEIYTTPSRPAEPSTCVLQKKSSDGQRRRKRRAGKIKKLSFNLLRRIRQAAMKKSKA